MRTRDARLAAIVFVDRLPSCSRVRAEEVAAHIIGDHHGHLLRPNWALWMTLTPVAPTRTALSQGSGTFHVPMATDLPSEFG